MIKVVSLLKYALLLGWFKRQVFEASSVWFKNIHYQLRWYNNINSRSTSSETSICSGLPNSNSFQSLRVTYKVSNMINLILISSWSSLSLTLYYLVLFYFKKKSNIWRLLNFKRYPYYLGVHPAFKYSNVLISLILLRFSPVTMT